MPQQTSLLLLLFPANRGSIKILWIFMGIQTASTGEAIRTLETAPAPRPAVAPAVTGDTSEQGSCQDQQSCNNLIFTQLHQFIDVTLCCPVKAVGCAIETARCELAEKLSVRALKLARRTAESVIRLFVEYSKVILAAMQPTR
jgi:hypothetical protein